MSVTTRSHRLEARIDPATNDLVNRAAAATGESRSNFVVRSLREAAARTLALADLTLMEPAVFDNMIQSLDQADAAPALVAAAQQPRVYQRR